jgi:hypothetical protein
LRTGETVLAPALTLLPAIAVIVVGSTGMVEAALNLGSGGASRIVILGTIVLAVLTSIPTPTQRPGSRFQRRGSAVRQRDLEQQHRQSRLRRLGCRRSSSAIARPRAGTVRRRLAAADGPRS